MTVVGAARVLVLDERSRFDTFVVGESTRDAAAAAQLVAESPGARWNPLVIRGGAGLGKSHLLGAVARRARELRPSLHVVAMSAAQPLPSRAAAADLLLVDDVRAGLPASQAAELRTLVDAAIAAGRQVVVAEDGSAPVSRDEASAWVAHSPRARLVRVGPPDDAARRAILRQAAEARSLSLGTHALDALAAERVTSVRELLGRLSRAGERQGIAGAPLAAPAAVAAAADDDFASFLDEVAREVASHVEPWRMRLGEAAAKWRAEGFEVAVLERALRLAQAPDVDALLATFEAATARLGRAQRRAAALDPALATHPAMHDPARVGEAEALLRAAAPRPAAVPNGDVTAPAAPAALDAESWVLEWPEVRDLVVETWS